MLPPPQRSMFFYSLLRFCGLDSLPTMSDLVRPYGYIYAPPPFKKTNRFMHFDLFAAAATTAIEMVTPPPPRTNLDHVIAHVCLCVVAARNRKHCKYP